MSPIRNRKFIEFRKSEHRFPFYGSYSILVVAPLFNRAVIFFFPKGLYIEIFMGKTLSKGFETDTEEHQITLSRLLLSFIQQFG